MALVTITLADNDDGNVKIDMQCHPGMSTENTDDMTNAQMLGLAMLDVAMDNGTESTSTE